jgi:hypothetical protein
MKLGVLPGKGNITIRRRDQKSLAVFMVAIGDSAGDFQAEWSKQVWRIEGSRFRRRQKSKSSCLDSQSPAIVCRPHKN